MPTVHKKFRLETEPIETTVDPDGHRTTSFASLNFRVLDAATDIPIGLVLHVRDGGDGMKYEAIPLYTNDGEPLNPPNGDWGKDVHGRRECCGTTGTQRRCCVGRSWLGGSRGGWMSTGRLSA